MNEQTIRLNQECPKNNAAEEKRDRGKRDSKSLHPTWSMTPPPRPRRPAYFRIKKKCQPTKNGNGNQESYDHFPKPRPGRHLVRRNLKRFPEDSCFNNDDRGRSFEFTICNLED